MATKKISVVYIMGDGRSGSTILSIILGNHHEIQAVGELDKWVHFKGKPKTGNIKQCDSLFWNSIFEKYANRVWSGSFDHLERAQHLIESYKFFPQVILNRTPSWAQELYHSHTTRLMTAIQSDTGKNIFVDSSKNMGRAWMLLRNPYLATKVIHLTRGPRATMWSVMKKNIEQKNKSPLVAMFQYSLKNFFCLLVGWRSRAGNVLRVRYEDIMLSPEQEFNRIGRFVGVDLAGISSMVNEHKPFKIPPLLDGNRIRNNEIILVSYDNTWQKKMPWSMRTLALCATLPCSCILGYLKRG